VRFTQSVPVQIPPQLPEGIDSNKNTEPQFQTSYPRDGLDRLHGPIHPHQGENA
jgi:hypothetical protein